MTAATRLGALGLAGCANDATDTGSSTATGATGEQVSAGLADRQILEQASRQPEPDRPVTMASPRSQRAARTPPKSKPPSTSAWTTTRSRCGRRRT